MSGRDVVVIGASAGGVQSLCELVRNLPGDFPGSVFVVLHLPVHAVSMLPSILNRCGKLPASHPVDNEPIQAGKVYVAPTNRHLIVQDGRVRAIVGPKENGHRPAVDVLFRSAAQAHGNRVIGVVLSGLLDDGTAGLAAIKRAGGIAIVQDPSEAIYPQMPQSAIAHVEVDRVLPLAEIASDVVKLSQESVADQRANPMTEDRQAQPEVDAFEEATLHNRPVPGEPSNFTCPECGGTLWELQQENLLRFRCRVGHAFSPESLEAEQAESLEAALWTALRALEESASLSRRLMNRALDRGHDRAAEQFALRVQDIEGRAAVIRQVLSGDSSDAALEASAAIETPSEISPLAEQWRGQENSIDRTP